MPFSKSRFDARGIRATWTRDHRISVFGGAQRMKEKGGRFHDDPSQDTVEDKFVHRGGKRHKLGD